MFLFTIDISISCRFSPYYDNQLVVRKVIWCSILFLKNFEEKIVCYKSKKVTSKSEKTDFNPG